jgi:hypothetical protein
MSRPMIAALFGALFLAACATSGDVISSRNHTSPVFIPALEGPALR